MKKITLTIANFKDGARPNAETEALTRLVPGGEPVLYDHSGKKTKLSTWMAIRRQRLGLRLMYDNFVRVRNPDGRLEATPELLPPGQYYVWLPDLPPGS